MNSVVSESSHRKNLKFLFPSKFEMNAQMRIVPVFRLALSGLVLPILVYEDSD
jgi:hypothetical protein